MCGRFTQYTPKNLMASHPVSKRVNDVRNDGEGCAAPLNLSLLDWKKRSRLPLLFTFPECVKTVAGGCNREGASASKVLIDELAFHYAVASRAQT